MTSAQSIPNSRKTFCRRERRTLPRRAPSPTSATAAGLAALMLHHLERGVQDVPDRELLLGGVELCHEPPLREDADAVADGDHLLELRRDDDEAEPLGRESPQGLEDLLLRAHVDPARRLVEGQQARPPVPPPP